MISTEGVCHEELDSKTSADFFLRLSLCHPVWGNLCLNVVRYSLLWVHLVTFRCQPDHQCDDLIRHHWRPAGGSTAFTGLPPLECWTALVPGCTVAFAASTHDSPYLPGIRESSSGLGSGCNRYHFVQPIHIYFFLWSLFGGDWLARLCTATLARQV